MLPPGCAFTAPVIGRSVQIPSPMAKYASVWGNDRHIRCPLLQVVLVSCIQLALCQLLEPVGILVPEPGTRFDKRSVFVELPSHSSTASKA